MEMSTKRTKATENEDDVEYQLEETDTTDQSEEEVTGAEAAPAESFQSKRGNIRWSTVPPDVHGRTAAANIIKMTPGVTSLSEIIQGIRDDVALPGFSHLFKENSEEEREHAEKLLSFQNKRGGRIVLQEVRKPEKDEWGSGLEAMKCALELEKNVNQALLDLHKLATDYVDPHLCDFLESHYLNEQVESIKKFGDHITNLTRMDAHNNKMEEYLFDKHTLGGKS
ncbi:ferritin, middle subunit-like [Xiphophorus hellerii]|uniref:ferritin, middle subunit-like n=1 Tax=Xiphophorus hellerii TaxID=8084 RepID=UPI0013B460F1|nr:ferritin, middle subunit-like [Xiphophorus hellerii]